MNLFSLRKKIQERAQSWEEGREFRRSITSRFNDEQIQELEWVLLELEDFEKELSSRLSELEKERNQSSSEGLINPHRRGMIDALRGVLGEKEEVKK